MKEGSCVAGTIARSTCYFCLMRKRKKRKNKKKKKKKKPIDNEAAELAVAAAKQELVESLAGKTGLSQEEVLAAHDQFYTSFPEGEISKEEFLQQSKVFSRKPLLSVLYFSFVFFFAGWSPGRVVVQGF